MDMVLKDKVHQIVYFIVLSLFRYIIHYDVGVGRGAPVSSPTF